jgi:putative acetyltransferase
MLHLRTTRPDDGMRLYEIWRTSVEATHHFLSAAHLAEIDELVRNYYLPNAPLLVAVDDQDIAHSFMGLTANRIDSLFVHADSQAKGAGRLLISDALGTHNQVLVDVNEQNSSGRGFYEHMGFRPDGRSETDDQGRPYPLLHLRRERGNMASITPVNRQASQ